MHQQTMFFRALQFTMNPSVISVRDPITQFFDVPQMVSKPSLRIVRDHMILTPLLKRPPCWQVNALWLHIVLFPPSSSSKYVF